MKTHLQANKGETRAPMAVCASRQISGGKLINNSRASYVGMESPIVRIAEFKLVPEADRCAHCCAELLIRRNRQRKAQGLAPVSTYNEKWDNLK